MKIIKKYVAIDPHYSDFEISFIGDNLDKIDEQIFDFEKIFRSGTSKWNINNLQNRICIMNEYKEKLANQINKVRFLDKYMEGHKGFIAGGCFKNIFNNEKNKRY